jgi:hypothetical protein
MRVFLYAIILGMGVYWLIFQIMAGTLKMSQH